MSIHVCKCEYQGHVEYHLRYPGISNEAAQELADRINVGYTSNSAVSDMTSLRKLRYQFMCDRSTPLTVKEIRSMLFPDEQPSTEPAEQSSSDRVAEIARDTLSGNSYFRAWSVIYDAVREAAPEAFDRTEPPVESIVAWIKKKGQISNGTAVKS